MFLRRAWRWIAILAAAVLLVTVVSVSSRQEEGILCMGVPVLDQAGAAQYTEYAYRDYSQLMVFNSEEVAADLSTSTIYISQPIDENTGMEDLAGRLDLQTFGCQMYFVADEAFNDLLTAVRDGHQFTLLVVDSLGRYMRYNVVLTTLPVLRLSGQPAEQMIDGWRPTYEGELCLWTPMDPEYETYSTKTSRAHWNVRGRTSAMEPKAPWKIELKDSEGGKKDLDFLGLGAEDDWILNSLCLEDTKVREKLMIELWNQMAADISWNGNMSKGEYVEVVMDGEYSGLYLLQRRVDEKYLGLDADDLLFKGCNIQVAATVPEAYELKYSSLTEEESYALMEGMLDCSDVSMIHVDNFVDVSLFLNFGYALDNELYKNIYYILRPNNGSYTLYMVPWDTDWSFGVWEPEEAEIKLFERREYEAMKALHPDLDQKMAQRWTELRGTVLTEENVEKTLAALVARITESDSLDRDQATWGQCYDGTDTVELVRSIIDARFKLLDEHYGQFLPATE